MTLKQLFKEGLITNNPVLVQRIGMCSTMAITTTLFNGIGMGLSVLIILTCCHVAISALRKAIPERHPPRDFRRRHRRLRHDSRPAPAGLHTGALGFARRLYPAYRRQLHHHRPRRGLLPARADWPELLGRHLPGLRLHRSPRGHVPYPRAPRLRHLRHRHLRDSQRRAARDARRLRRRHPHLPRAVRRDDTDNALRRLPHPGPACSPSCSTRCARARRRRRRPARAAKVEIPGSRRSKGGR